ncbi:matrilin-4-like [Gigantopelta aegis]|uniref:matrilin-4-like n=1 Tax=Gigantopelta aegis TaxID=1735272 RepID=UPI001B88B863|nr:matrilin-4-like [Gigantopelta aegis]
MNCASTMKIDVIVSVLENSLVLDIRCEDEKLDLIIALDASASVANLNFQLLLNFVKDLLSIVSIDNGNVRAGLLIYSTRVHIQFQLNTFTSKGEIYDAINNTSYEYGSTNTAAAIQTMRTMFSPRNGERLDAKNVGILITDGLSNINPRRTIPEAERARAEGIHSFVIGVGLTNTSELEEIANPPTEPNLFIVKEFSELRILRNTVFQSLCGDVDCGQPPTIPGLTLLGFDHKYLGGKAKYTCSVFNVRISGSTDGFAESLCIVGGVLAPPDLVCAHTVTCDEGYYKCPQSYFIPIEFVCNGVMDCVDGADEHVCAREQNLFQREYV